MYITVKSPNPHEAAAIANEYASVALKYIASTMATEEPNIMSVALEPTNPTSPNKTINILLGFAIGLVVAITWITLRFVMDDKIQNRGRYPQNMRACPHWPWCQPLMPTPKRTNRSREVPRRENPLL